MFLTLCLLAQKRLQPNHLELGHFDQQVLRRLKGLSETAALEVLYWVPTREKMVSTQLCIGLVG